MSTKLVKVLCGDNQQNVKSISFRIYMLMNNFFPLCLPVFPSPIFPPGFSITPTFLSCSPSPPCMSRHWSPSLLHPVPFSPLHIPLHAHSTPLFFSPQPRSLSLTPHLSPPFSSPHPNRYASIPSWQLYLLLTSPLSSLSLVGFHSCGE